MRKAKLQYKTYTPQRLDTLTIRYMSVGRRVENDISVKYSFGDILSKLSRLAANPFRI